MSDQPPSGNNNNPNNNPNRPAGSNPNNNRRHNNQRRRPHGPNPNQNQNRDGNAGPGPRPQQANTAQGQAPQGQAQAPREGGNSGGGQRRRHGRSHNNRPRNPNPQGQSTAPGPQGSSIERIYEKYLNLLDQHLIARRKYHDLFYRADPAQKNKLERNFYNSLHDIREFENKLSPESRILFEKRNNGLKQDNIYTTNHELPVVGENPPPVTECADPHFLQTQKLASYGDDKEESVGSAEDYLKYKNLL